MRDLKNRGIGVRITDHNVRETLEIVDRAGAPGNTTTNANSRVTGTFRVRQTGTGQTGTGQTGTGQTGN